MRSLRFVLSLVPAVLVAGLAAPPAFASDSDDGPPPPSFLRPVLVLGGDFGVSAMNEGGPFGFGGGIGAVTRPGPAWGLRVGVELLRWLAVEVKYAGMYDSLQASVSPAGSLGYLTTGLDALVRLTLPVPFVHPYLLAGAGYYDVSLTGSATAKAGSPMHSSSQPGIPLGVGVDVPVTGRISVGAEAIYHFVLGESFSNVDTNGMDGGDLSTFTAVVRYRL